MKLQLKTIKTVIVATAILHNNARNENDEDPPAEIQVPHDEEIENVLYVQNNNRGNLRRNALIAQYFSR